MKLTINGKTQTVDVPGDMPLLWVLRDVIGLTGTKFGCGIAACGACTVRLEGRPIRSCGTPVSTVARRQITTIEAIGATPAGAPDTWCAKLGIMTGARGLQSDAPVLEDDAPRLERRTSTSGERIALSDRRTRAPCCRTYSKGRSITTVGEGTSPNWCQRGVFEPFAGAFPLVRSDFVKSNPGFMESKPEPSSMSAGAVLRTGWRDPGWGPFASTTTLTRRAVGAAGRRPGITPASIGSSAR